LIRFVSSPDKIAYHLL